MADAHEERALLDLLCNAHTACQAIYASTGVAQVVWIRGQAVYGV